MIFQILSAFILINCLTIEARGRIPIVKTGPVLQFANEEPFDSRNSHENVDLPRGFNPLPPPVKPLLYPFATEPSNGHFNPSTSGWRPIIPSSSTLKPRLEDRRDSHQDVRGLESPLLESIVYGDWMPQFKPNPPDFNQARNPLIEHQSKEYETSDSIEESLRERLDDFIEEIGLRKTLINGDPMNPSSPKTYNNKKIGRRKIPRISSKTNSKEQMGEANDFASKEIERVNPSNPQLIEMVKQINESVELSKKEIEIKSNLGMEGSLTTEPPREWPTDFMTSKEKKNHRQEQPPNFSSENAEPPRLSTESNWEKLPAIATFNITKMGVPYENRNSGEEPSICVPLSVREYLQSNPLESVEVERVYCFPLPPQPENKMPDENDTRVYDKDGHFNVLSYEELATSGGAAIRHLIWIFILNLLFF